MRREGQRNSPAERQRRTERRRHGEGRSVSGSVVGDRDTAQLPGFAHSAIRLGLTARMTGELGVAKPWEVNARNRQMKLLKSAERDELQGMAAWLRRGNGCRWGLDEGRDGLGPINTGGRMRIGHSTGGEQLLILGSKGS